MIHESQLKKNTKIYHKLNKINPTTALHEPPSLNLLPIPFKENNNSSQLLLYSC